MSAMVKLVPNKIKGQVICTDNLESQIVEHYPVVQCQLPILYLGLLDIPSPIPLSSGLSILRFFSDDGNHEDDLQSSPSIADEETFDSWQDSWQDVSVCTVDDIVSLSAMLLLTTMKNNTAIDIYF